MKAKWYNTMTKEMIQRMCLPYTWGFPGGSVVRNPPGKRGMRVGSLGQEDPLEKERATHSSIFAWKIPWTEELGGLQPTGSQRVGHKWPTEHVTEPMWTFLMIVRREIVLFYLFIFLRLFYRRKKVNSYSVILTGDYTQHQEHHLTTT